MAAITTNGTKKRKHTSKDTEVRQEIPEDVGLEMQSEDEDEDQEGSVKNSEDEGEDAEEFPGLNTDSDSDNDEDEGEDEDDEDEDEEGSEDDPDEESDSDGSLHVFPRAKIVQSKITGQPKKVYPEIEPDYDSDSSTEEVSRLHVAS